MDKEANLKLMHDRIQLVRDAAAFKPVSRIPNISFIVTWRYLDAGYRLKEALMDLDIMEDCIIKQAKDYKFDMLIEAGTRNAYRVNLPLGNPCYNFDDEADAISFPDKELVHYDELLEFAKNPKKYTYEVLFPRRYPVFDENFDISKMQEAANEKLAFNAFLARVMKRLNEELGVAKFCDMFTAPVPLENLMNSYCGLKGFAIVLRRNAEYLDDVWHALYETQTLPMLNSMKNAPEGPNMMNCFDAQFTMLCHTMINLKQFDKYYWPVLKENLDIIYDKGKNMRLFIEGEGSRFFDYIKDYPKGYITLHLDTDDVFETRKALPNCAIKGGMPIVMLGHDTPEACVDHVKKVVDGLHGEGFMLCQDKMATYRKDIIAENLKAVSDFIVDYQW